MIPPSPNVMRRKYRHPMAYRHLRKQWEQALSGYALVHCGTSEVNRQIKCAEVGERFNVEITLGHSRPYDPDNLPGSLKVVLDALKNIHFIADDDAQSIELEPPLQEQTKRKECFTRIRIAHILPF